MKTFSLALNVLLLTAIILMACNAEQDNGSGKPNKSAGSKSPCALCGDFSSQDPPGAISADIVKKLTGAYSRDVSKRMIDHVGEGQSSDDEDALALVFSLEQIKNLIWHMEHAKCENNSGCKDRTELGIRFYYIKYSEDAMLHNQTAPQEVQDELTKLYNRNSDKHSLAMVPVYKSGKDWLDFDYSNICGDINTIPSKGKNPLTAAVIQVSGDNHGNLAPPPQEFHYPHMEQ